MGKRFVFLFFGLASLLFVSPASATGDGGCTAEWKLTNPAMTGCNNLPALGPGNDTRVNLLLLLFDRHGAPPEKPSAQLLPATDFFVDGWRSFREHFFTIPAEETTGYADGEGSRCRSNASGESGFEAALDAAPDLPAEERTILRAARKALKPTCTDNKNATAATADDAVQQVRSASGQAFATYLRGVTAFYDGRFDEAATAFSSLKGSADPWIADTSAYMVARVEVNHLQVGAYDQYGDFQGSAKVDQQIATRAEASLNAYLHDYPAGKYAASARGLLRRVNWVAGRTEKLAAQYAELLAMPPATRGISDDVLAAEIDYKLLPQLNPQQSRDLAVPEHERQMALFTLLYKDLTRGRYDDFLSDIAKVPSDAPVQGSVVRGEKGHPPLGVFTQTEVDSDIDCPALRTTVGTLARNSSSPHARLCLSEFLRANSPLATIDTQFPKDQLGGTVSLFPGKPITRGTLYQAVIADARAPAADKAYALFRAVNCYAPSRTNGCGGAEVSLAQRKAWFVRLKRDYASSSWAKELRYWW